MDPADLLPRSAEETFLNVPYEERWERLRDVIVRLYMGNYGPGRNTKGMTASQVAQFMKHHYSFHAAESQYKNRFRQWGVRKRIFTSEKNEIVSALGRRPRPGTSASNVKLDQGDLDKPVDTKQLKRHLKDQIRHRQVEPMSPGVLSSWNLPYAAYAAALPTQPDQPSPFGTTAVTPTYLNIQSPEAMTPGRQAAGPSPTTQLVRQKVPQDRSALLLQGRHRELLVSCGREDRMILTNYLHDFHVQSFVTAKYWGRGPLVWTGQMISVLTQGALDIAPTPSTSLASAPSPSASRNRPNKFEAPTQLCRWAIHLGEDNICFDAQFDRDEPQVVEQDVFDIGDPSSWCRWSQSQLSERSFSTSMQESITHSTFTATPPEDLPISTQSIEQSLQADPNLLQVDAYKFAIMAGNMELLESLGLRPSRHLLDGIKKIHPFHLAATFLDGGHTCCGIIQRLTQHLGEEYVFGHNTDDLGHTVLDALMISILRSHTSVNPELVSTSFRAPNRLPGEEKDICGRWDADSPAVRELFQHGYARIPNNWKHPFCHTAAQAICHSVTVIFCLPTSPDINTPSGLFLRRCNNCGLGLKLGPLHMLIVVAFYLAHRGMPGETMFGALAILVCLVSLGADVSLRTAMSIENILGTAEPGRCHHTLLDACDLMRAVPQALVDRWSMECRTGWLCILQILRLTEISKPGGEHCESEGNPDDDGDANPYCPCEVEGQYEAHSEWLKLPCGNPDLGLLWAIIQVELLTYRRVEDGTPLISDNFSMDALNTWLQGKSPEFSTPLVQRKMMREHSRCGWFLNCFDEELYFLRPVASDVCREYFMNMDINDRARKSFIYV